MGDRGMQAAGRASGKHAVEMVAKTCRSALTGGERGYWVARPRRYASREQWPLIVMLHGMGERGDDPRRARIHGVLKEVAKPDRDLPFVVLGPHCPSLEAEGAPPTMWDAMEEDLLRLLDDTLATERVDPSRVYLTGLSMGGFGTWWLGSRHPSRFAALAPVCGWGETAWTASLAAMPVWAFHGDKDEAVPCSRSIEMVSALRKLNPSARFTRYPDLSHNCWDRAYGSNDLFAWFLQHRRRAGEVEPTGGGDSRGGAD